MAEEVKVVETVEEVVEKPKRTRAKKVEGEVAEKKTTKRTTKKAETAETEVKKTPAKKTTKKATKSAVQEFLGTGKRKTSVARVRVTTGTGVITVNGKELKEYFGLESLIGIAKQPLVLTYDETQHDQIESELKQFYTEVVESNYPTE